MAKEIWEEHALLFHYTSTFGLLGILNSQTLHATHCAYLNDEFETVSIKQSLARYVAGYLRPTLTKLSQSNSDASETIKKLGGLRAAAEREAQAFVDVLHRTAFNSKRKPNFFEPFVVSFCAHEGAYEQSNGLLSQWRAYANASGYALAFDTRLLHDFVLHETQKFAYGAVFIGDVIYDDEEEKFLVEFAPLLQQLKAIIPELYTDRRTSLLDGMFSHFVTSALRLKHRGFREESEVRAVLPPISPYWAQQLKLDQPDDYKRHIDGRILKPIWVRENLSPYIVIGEDAQVVLPIRYIIVGPSSDKSLRCDRLKKLLDLKGIEVDVKLSDTPLR